MATAVSSLYPEASEVRAGRLAIGGCGALELAREFGTPLSSVAEGDPTGRAGWKFGLRLSDAREAIERLRAAPWANLRGVHMHIGSQLFDLAPWRAAVQAIATLGEFAEYDLGGGLAVAYTPVQRPPSVE